MKIVVRFCGCGFLISAAIPGAHGEPEGVEFEVGHALETPHVMEGNGDRGGGSGLVSDVAGERGDGLGFEELRGGMQAGGQFMHLAGRVGEFDRAVGERGLYVVVLYLIDALVVEYHR